MRNRLPKTSSSQDKIPPEHSVIVDLVRLIGEHTKEHGTRIQGQCAIEMPKRMPVICMYASYPSGDYLCWFNDGENFRMYALVNEKLVTVLECPNTEMGKLQEALTEIKTQLEAANPPDAPQGS